MHPCARHDSRALRSRYRHRRRIGFRVFRGLVSYQLNRGAVVIAMSTSEICELPDIRAALESYAAKLAVPNMVSADIELMKRILASYGIATTPVGWAECNRQLHLASCAPSNNERLKKMIEEYCLSMTNRYAAVRGHDRHGIVACFEASMNNSRAGELPAAWTRSIRSRSCDLKIRSDEHRRFRTKTYEESPQALAESPSMTVQPRPRTLRITACPNFLRTECINTSTALLSTSLPPPYKRYSS